MRENNRATFTLLFYIKGTKVLRNGEVPIYARITINRQRAEFSVGRSIVGSNWDNKKNRAKGSSKTSEEINGFIKTIENKVYNLHRDILHRDDYISAKSLSNEYQGKTVRETTIVELFQEHNTKMFDAIGIDFKRNTFKKYKSGINHLKEFIKQVKNCNDVPIRNIDLKFINDFDYYLTVSANLKAISVNTTTSTLKKIIKIAIVNGIIQSNPFLGYKTKKVITHRKYLTPSELIEFENAEVSSERLQRVKDVFIFCCYTGLSHCDVKSTTKKNIALNIRGQKSLVGFRQKTNIEYTVPLLEPALEILDKYESLPPIPDNCLLPVISNQKMNEYLLEITNSNSISKKITCHMARHTFATTIVLFNDVPMETLKTMMAHTDIQTTQHYGKIMNDKVFKDMLSVNDKINNRKVG